ncbi:vesicle-associated protein 1-2-like [Tripterygium wilfordii]|uniref:vesicle-associated protein 1-2-like n=1 Tax=Tripterygium wilfordii TaxID=458696 RepID=UPI0018F7EC7A|nr:vesicle-associated protein 1-2-like [Tripterygium wilfordii]
MQAQKEAPSDMQCKDKFLLQSEVASPGATVKDITPEMFNKETGNQVEESKLRVLYVAPPRPLSPVLEGSEEDSSPWASVSDNGNLNASEYTAVVLLFHLIWRLEYNLYNVCVYKYWLDNFGYNLMNCCTDIDRETGMISKLAKEKNSAIQQSSKLQQELELIKEYSQEEIFIVRERANIETYHVHIIYAK